MPLPKLLFAGAVWIIAAAPAAATDYPPFDFQEVGFTKDCQPNAAFERLMTLMTGPSRRMADDEQPDIDGPLYDAISGDTTHSLMLDTPKPWHGLKLIGVNLAFGIERGPANYMLLFEDDAQKVRTTWNNLGWMLPAIDDVRDVDGLEGYAFIGVSRSGNGAMVGCFRD